MADLPVLTNSRLRMYRECSRKEFLAYQQGWRPAVEPDALRFGSLVHLGLEAYWDCLRYTENDRFAEEHGRDPYRDLFLEAALARIEGKARDEFEQIRVDAMISFYAQRWGSGDYSDYEVLAVEPQFECPLLNPETMAPSKTWRFAGKLDAIVRRKSDGRVLVVEHKTSSEDVRGDDADYWTRLAMDPQCSAYVVGAEALGYQVDEILYDVLVKPAQRPLKATPVEARKFTKDGRLYAAQREFDETPDEYRVRIQEAIASDLDRYFARRAVPRSNSQIQDWMWDAWQQGRTMREAELAGRAPRNPDACLRMGRCQFWQLCSTGGKPEDYPAEFVKVENVHQELNQ